MNSCSRKYNEAFVDEKSSEFFKKPVKLEQEDIKPKIVRESDDDVSDDDSIDRESMDDESSLSTDEEKYSETKAFQRNEAMDLVRRPLTETGRNGRSEENGNSQQISSKEIRLQYEIELIHRRLIGTGDIKKLRELMTRNLYKGNWKHEVLGLCRAAVKKKSDQITFQQLYTAVKEEAEKIVSNEVKNFMREKVKSCYQQAIENTESIHGMKMEIKDEPL